MGNAVLIAMALGYVGGIALTYFFGRAVVIHLGGRTTFSDIIGMLGVVGGLVALAPALFFATIVGGLGGGYGEVVSTSLGLGSVGVPIGMVLGLIAVTALVATCGVLIGAGIGRLINALSRQAT